MGRRWQVWGAVAALAVGGMMPAGVRAASTTVSIQIPAAQRLEGATAVWASAAGVVRGTAVVKSNIPWTLVAEVADGPEQVFWRAAGGAWQRVGARSPVLSGQAGVHPVDYQLRLIPGPAGSPSVLVRLSVVPARP